MLNRPFRAARLGGCCYTALRAGLVEPGLQPGKRPYPVVSCIRL